MIPHVDLAVRFILEQQDVVAIPGMDKLEHIVQNLAPTKQFVPFNAVEIAKLEAAAKELGPNFCRRCGYCLPCVAGIDIPTMFIFTFSI